jgi:hypothetical protein
MALFYRVRRALNGPTRRCPARAEEADAVLVARLVAAERSLAGLVDARDEDEDVEQSVAALRLELAEQSSQLAELVEEPECVGELRLELAQVLPSV